MAIMTFNGVSKPYLKVLKGRKRPSWSPIKRQVLTMPGLAGGYVNETTVDVRVIEVPVLIKASSYPDLQKVKEDLAAWLITDQECELIFDDEADRTYFASVDGSFDPEELVNLGRGIITFICPDPYKYSAEKTASFVDAGTVTVGGTVESEPIITVNITADTTYVAVGNGDKVNLIGNPTQQTQVPVAPETSVVIDACNTLTGWATSSATSVENSDITGTMKTDGINFYTDSYGSSVNWHGPAVKKSLGQTLADFRLDMGFHIGKTGNGQAGGVEVCLLDANSKVICKLAMTKHYGGTNTLYPKLRAGSATNGYDVIPESESNFQSSFSGVLRMYRKGNVWTAQIFKLVNGKYQSPYTKTWTDFNNIAAAGVTQVQARLIQRAAFPVTQQYIGDIQVYKLNNVTANQIPIIAKAGDIVTFDHQTDIIQLNGMDITKEKAFIGEYFPLLPGANAIVAEPADSVGTVEVRWRDRWR